MTPKRSLAAGLVLAALSVGFAYKAIAEEVPCDPASRIVRCEPPATYVSKTAQTPDPFDAPVRFGGAITEQGVTRWLWIKTGEPSRPCSAAQLAGSDHYAKGCHTRIGDVLYSTRAFLVKP